MTEVAKLISEYQQNLQKHVNICCCSFNKILIKEKKTLLEEILTNGKFLPNDKF